MHLDRHRPKRRWTELAAGAVRWIAPTAIRYLVEILFDLDE